MNRRLRFDAALNPPTLPNALTDRKCFLDNAETA